MIPFSIVIEQVAGGVQAGGIFPFSNTSAVLVDTYGIKYLPLM